jgi:C4-dicarboxylate-specific signal transduction histidine kinase
MAGRSRPTRSDGGDGRDPDPGAVLVDWAPDGDGGLLRVIDGGATLSAEQARELATPFDMRRVQPDARERRSGLNLPIATTLLSLLGGDLDIRPTPEGGVAYRLRIPPG